MALLRVAMERLARTSRNGETWLAYDLDADGIEEDDGFELHRLDVNTLELRADTHPFAVTSHETFANLTALATDIDRSTYYGDYKDVKDDPEWRILYSYGLRNLTAKLGAVWGTVSENSSRATSAGWPCRSTGSRSSTGSRRAGARARRSRPCSSASGAWAGT
jgi:hypothetical protein